RIFLCQLVWRVSQYSVRSDRRQHFAAVAVVDRDPSVLVVRLQESTTTRPTTQDAHIARMNCSSKENIGPAARSLAFMPPSADARGSGSSLSMEEDLAFQRDSAAGSRWRSLSRSHSGCAR